MRQVFSCTVGTPNLYEVKAGENFPKAVPKDNF